MRISTGVVDVDKEKERLTKQQGLLTTKLQDLQSRMALPGYTDKIPQEVHEANLAKQKDLTAELEKIAESIECLSLIK